MEHCTLIYFVCHFVCVCVIIIISLVLMVRLWLAWKKVLVDQLMISCHLFFLMYIAHNKLLHFVLVFNAYLPSIHHPCHPFLLSCYRQTSSSSGSHYSPSSVAPLHLWMCVLCLRAQANHPYHVAHTHTHTHTHLQAFSGWRQHHTTVLHHHQRLLS